MDFIARRKGSAALLCLVVVSANDAAAQDSAGRMPWQEYNERIRATELVAPLTSEIFGEQISLYDGSTEFAVTDASIPGNSGLPVELRRRFKVESKKEMEFFGGFGEWDLDVPYLFGVFTAAWKWNEGGNGATGRCSEPWYPRTGTFYDLDEIWSGNYAHVPGQGDKVILRIGDTEAPAPTDGRNYPWATRDFNVLSCLAPSARSQGEGFVLHTTDGLRYTFDTAIERSAGRINKHGTRIGRTKVFLAASRVEDRFGNWVAWRYQGERLVAIESNDGRRIDLQWEGAQVASVTVNGRRWSYSYIANTDNASNYPYSKPRLSQVILPDDSAWSYAYSGSLAPIYTPLDIDTRNCPSMPRPQAGFTVEATHPAGAHGRFEFSLRRHHRSGTPANACVLDGKPNRFRQMKPDYFDVYSISRKVISGPGLLPRDWTWEYRSRGSMRATGAIPCLACARGKTVTLTQPDGTKLAHDFGTLFGYDDGRLLATRTIAADDRVVREVSTGYVQSAEDHPFPDVHGYPWGVDDPASAQIRPARETRTVQDGETYVNTVEHFDSLARPVRVNRANSLAYGAYDVVETLSYHDDRAGWVLGQPGRKEQVWPNEAVQSEVHYDARGLPWKSYVFGALQDVRTYHSDATLATLQDAAGNTTWLHDWKRGVPQRIVHADGSTLAALVDDNGWLGSVTDQRGATRRYAYDAMGRLASLHQPEGDDVAWLPTTQQFVQVMQDERGIPGGHWRQTVSTGSAHKVTLFNALWQPLLTEQWDARDRVGTLSQRTWAYDTMGRTAFSSRPTRKLDTVNAVVPGTRSAYDALGRVIREQADSELGVLTTTIDYLSGNARRVTAPGNHVTTTTYLARDLPEADAPVSVATPEGTFTDIERDSFGKPVAIRRRNTDSTVALTRRYVYDGQQRLCKQIEPETGATVTEYDVAGNIAWTAAGLSLTDAASCSRGQAAGSDARADRSYDSMNRISALVFKDGNGNQAWNYWPDGRVREVTALNAGVSVRRSYDYNQRGLPVRESMDVGDGHSLVLRHRYDAIGSLAAHVYPDGSEIEYAPNALGLPTQAGRFADSVARHADGGLAGFKYGNGIQHAVTQNVRGLPDRRRDHLAGVPVLDDGYDYDARGNLAAISDGATGGRGNRDMQYDGLDRLTATDSPASGQARYAYDVLDNIASLRIGERNHRYYYDGSNRLTNVLDVDSGATVIALGYDAQGNVIRRNGQMFAFDIGNRLREASGLETYRYDGHGRRVLSIGAGGAETISLYDAGGVLRFQKSAVDASAYNYYYLDGRLLARTASVAEPMAPVVEAPGWTSTGSYSVRWTAIKGATRYEVTESSDDGVQTLHDGGGLSVDVAGRDSGQYSYRARACNTAGCSAWGAAASTFVSIPPRPSAGITAPALGVSGNFTVQWLPPIPREVGNTSYVLDWRSEADWVEAYRGEQLQHAFSGMQAGTYVFRVRTCNPLGCSEPVQSTGTTVVYPPSAPTLTAPPTNIGPQLTVTWSAAPGAQTYHLEESFGGGTWSRIHSGSSLSILIGNRLSGQYRYRVQACNQAGCGEFSNEAIINSVVAPSDAPVLSVGSHSTNGAYSLAWTALPYVDRYVLHEALPSGAWQVIHNGTGSAATVSGRWTGRWHYEVQACNAAGCGPRSRPSAVDVFLPPGMPQITSSKKFTINGRLSISWRCNVAWSASPDTTYYELTNAKGAMANMRSETRTSVVIRTGGFGNNVACWNEHAVRACNASGCSAWSPMVTQPHEHVDDRI